MPEETPEQTDSAQDRNLRQAYVFAREERAQADNLLWEVSAIIWGGQTLLLGFALEAISGSKAALVLIIVVSYIGIRMASFNEGITNKRSEVCRAMVAVMVDIENKLKMPIQPQQIITNAYEEGFQTKWSKKLNGLFSLAWGAVAVVAALKLLYDFLEHCGHP
jgi:hypothetical protein